MTFQVLKPKVKLVGSVCCILSNMLCSKGSASEDQAVNEGDVSSEDCHANSPPTPSDGQTSHPPTLSGTLIVFDILYMYVDMVVF